MKIDDISAFVAVVRNQSVSAAAEALGLTQSAITRRLQNLEQDLGVELLDRSVKPPRPNAMGRLVFDQCGKVLLEVERLRDLVQEGAAPTGVFRIGVIQTIGDVVLLDTLQRLNAAFAGLQTEVASGWGAQLVERVVAGQIDAAVALFPATKALPDGLAGRPGQHRTGGRRGQGRHAQAQLPAARRRRYRLGAQPRRLRFPRRPGARAGAAGAEFQDQSGDLWRRPANGTGGERRGPGPDSTPHPRTQRAARQARYRQRGRLPAGARYLDDPAAAGRPGAARDRLLRRCRGRGLRATAVQKGALSAHIDIAICGFA